MHKSELIDYIASRQGCTKVEAEKIINIFTDAIINALGKGQEVVLVGFGNFYTTKVAEKEGRNPKTGQPLTIPAYTQPKFKSGKKLKDACNVVT
jgi:DNA-binding protein HU-beta